MLLEPLLPPGVLFIIGAFFLPVLSQAKRGLLVMGLPAVILLVIWSIPADYSVQAHLFGYEIEPIRNTATGRVFATIFSIMAFAGSLFAWKQANTLELTAAMIYAGSAIGVTFAGDLFTLLVFWEIMAVGSTLVLWAAGTPEATRAAMRYLLVHLFGGVILMIGIAGHVAQTGSLDFVPMRADTPAHWFMLAGFLINAGAPPLSAWVADAYPEASPSGAVFLSAFTTKTAVFTLIMGFPGTWILIPIGVYMIFYGIIYALLENDMRRILAYSIINQVGFMVVGVGIGTEMALNGATAHAFAHIIYKALLLMSAGAVLYQTGKRKCTDLGGLFQSMPLTALFGIVGALAISSFPFTSGFISKSMVTQAAADQHLMWVWYGLVAASAGVFLHAGIKFPWFVFFQKDSGLRPKDPPSYMLIPMALFAFLCVFLGLFPNWLYGILPYPVNYQPYTADHLVTQFQLLLFAGLAFFVMLPMMKRTLTISLDFDWLYRRLLKIVGSAFVDQMSESRENLEQNTRRQTNRLLSSLSHYHGPEGVLARDWPVGNMALWAVLILGVSLLVYFI